MRSSRRAFCISAASSLSGAALVWCGIATVAAERAGVNIVEVDRRRVLRAATRYLREDPITITAYRAERSAGGKHDYFSEGDYWWPDPEHPDGPYIQRDGMTNPDNFVAHRHALIRLSVQMPALTAAWLITKKRVYAQHAARHLRAWFLDPSTWMSPNLQYSQAIHGRVTGRGIGVIDTIHLVEVARAIPHLRRASVLSADEHAGLEKWFAHYLDWMTHSSNGLEEREAKNNHGTCWVMQAAEFAQYTGNQELIEYCRERYKHVLLPNQVAADGSFPQELRRTKPYSYCLFNLDAMATICQILSSPGDDLWSFRLPDGRSMQTAMQFMVPYIADKHTWPHPADVQYFDQFPVRQPSLLFAGLAYAEPRYLALWAKLNPDSQVEEVIRNYPIRQPVLWVA
ncbi:MAG: alginate lyase family protein [Steroidobacteraceae bacterium]